MLPVETRWKRASLLDEVHDDDEVVHGLSIEAAGNIKDDDIANQMMLFLFSVSHSVHLQHLCLSYVSCCNMVYYFLIGYCYIQIHSACAGM